MKVAVKINKSFIYAWFIIHFFFFSLTQDQMKIVLRLLEICVFSSLFSLCVIFRVLCCWSYTTQGLAFTELNEMKDKNNFSLQLCWLGTSKSFSFSADDEFADLCFDYGLELDEVVRNPFYSFNSFII